MFCCCCCYCQIPLVQHHRTSCRVDCIWPLTQTEDTKMEYVCDSEATTNNRTALNATWCAQTHCISKNNFVIYLLFLAFIGVKNRAFLLSSEKIIYAVKGVAHFLLDKTQMWTLLLIIYRKNWRLSRTDMNSTQHVTACVVSCRVVSCYSGIWPLDCRSLAIAGVMHIDACSTSILTITIHDSLPVLFIVKHCDVTTMSHCRIHTPSGHTAHKGV